ncbi:MAG: transhydrogenase beta subunit [Mycobacterium sp.]|nr:transhydrogenase beta subunit [Mycobacterium sp.]
MFTAKQPRLTAHERGLPLVPVVIALVNTYAGLSLAVAGFVLDNTAMIVAVMILVGSGSMLIRWPRSMRARKVNSASHFIDRGGP